MKKIYYQLSDNADVSKIVLCMEDVKNWIESDMEGIKEEDDEVEYTITPIWLTDEEFNNLPEANF